MQSATAILAEQVSQELFAAFGVEKCNLTGTVSRESQGIIAQGAFADVRRGIWNVQEEASHPTTGGDATLTESGVVVAIKELRVVSMPNGSLQGILAKMFHEIGMWYYLRHANILPFYGYTIDPAGTIALISPWCDFGNINVYLTQYPQASRENLALDVAEGIAYLHSLSIPIVHGDLKGGNILVNQRHIACLCDFGISLFAEETGHHTGFTGASAPFNGSVRWMAPELLRSTEPRKTFASDMYALAGTFLEIFCGIRPYYYVPTESLVVLEIALDRMHQRDRYEFIGSSGELWGLLLLLWDSDSSKRPTANAVVATLYTYWGLRPREDITFTLRPARLEVDARHNTVYHPITVGMTDTGNTFESLSPDGRTFCVLRSDLESGEEVQLYDLATRHSRPRFLFPFDGYEGIVTFVWSVASDLVGIFMTPYQWEAVQPSRVLVANTVTGVYFSFRLPSSLRLVRDAEFTRDGTLVVLCEQITDSSTLEVKVYTLHFNVGDRVEGRFRALTCFKPRDEPVRSCPLRCHGTYIITRSRDIIELISGQRTRLAQELLKDLGSISIGEGHVVAQAQYVFEDDEDDDDCTCEGSDFDSDECPLHSEVTSERGASSRASTSVPSSGVRSSSQWGQCKLAWWTIYPASKMPSAVLGNNLSAHMFAGTDICFSLETTTFWPTLDGQWIYSYDSREGAVSFWSWRSPLSVLTVHLHVDMMRSFKCSIADNVATLVVWSDRVVGHSGASRFYNFYRLPLLQNG